MATLKDLQDALFAAYQIAQQVPVTTESEPIIERTRDLYHDSIVAKWDEIDNAKKTASEFRARYESAVFNAIMGTVIA